MCEVCLSAMPCFLINFDHTILNQSVEGKILKLLSVNLVIKLCIANMLMYIRKHVHEMYTPLTPLLYSENGVCRGIPIFLFLFAPKHRLWVLVRTASTRFSKI